MQTVQAIGAIATQHSLGLLYVAGSVVAVILSFAGKEVLWAISWATSVACVCVVLALCAMSLIRDILSPSLPDAAKRCPYPLFYNGGLPAESVWAYSYSRRALCGAPADSKQLLFELDWILACHPQFDRTKALHRLGELDIVEKDVIHQGSIALSSPSDRKPSDKYADEPKP